mmetsp:Transcript_266/g.555  ORF Transcript_266/g.555 Transcript_266/m.555 type:complete len:229 (-) Transcript_266:301-987(-)
MVRLVNTLQIWNINLVQLLTRWLLAVLSKLSVRSCTLILLPLHATLLQCVVIVMYFLSKEKIFFYFLLGFADSFGMFRNNFFVLFKFLALLFDLLFCHFHFVEVLRKIILCFLQICQNLFVPFGYFAYPIFQVLDHWLILLDLLLEFDLIFLDCVQHLLSFRYFLFLSRRVGVHVDCRTFFRFDIIDLLLRVIHFFFIFLQFSLAHIPIFLLLGMLVLKLIVLEIPIL